MIETIVLISKIYCVLAAVCAALFVRQICKDTNDLGNRVTMTLLIGVLWPLAAYSWVCAFCNPEED